MIGSIDVAAAEIRKSSEALIGETRREVIVHDWFHLATSALSVASSHLGKVKITQSMSRYQRSVSLPGGLVCDGRFLMT